MELTFLTALWDALRDEGRRIVPSGELMDASNVLLTGTSLLAAWRCRHHPALFRRVAMWLYATLCFLMMPARAEDIPTVGKLLAYLGQSVFMISCAWPPGDFELFKRYWAERNGEHDDAPF